MESCRDTATKSFFEIGASHVMGYETLGDFFDVLSSILGVFTCEPLSFAQIDSCKSTIPNNIHSMCVFGVMNLSLANIYL